MLRTDSLTCWLIAVVVCLAGTTHAQGPNTPRPQAGAMAPVGRVPAKFVAGQPAELTPPGLIELAQDKPQTLVDRLKAIRGGGGTAAKPVPEPGEYDTSSRRTADRRSARTEVPHSPTPRDSEPSVSTGATSTGTAERSLSSVLVHRDTQPGNAAPITSSSDLITTESSSNQPTGLSDAFAASTAQPSSSRRSARRRRPPATTTYDAPSTHAPSTTHQSSTSTTGSQLSMSQQGPTLRVETQGPKAIAVGKKVTYRIRLVNQGSVSARRVVVSATLPVSVQIISAQARLGKVDKTVDSAGGKLVTWTIDQVSASSQQELAVTLKATENKPLDLKVDWIYRPASLSARIDVQQPQLAVSVDGPVEMRYGETKVFKVKLSNPGNGPAENVSVNIAATGANGRPNSIGTLAAGQSRTLELELTANQAGTMQIRAVARGDGALQAESAHDIRVRQAKLAVQITAPGLVYAGTTATYKIRVANRGDAVAAGVVMQVELPTGAKNGIGVDKKPITLEQPRWRIGDLSPGAERVYSMQCDLNVSGQNQLVARLQGTGDVSASDTAMTAVEAIADLKLVINDPKGPVPLGKDVVYEIKVLNRGSKEALDVSVVAQFSEGIEPSATAGQRGEIVPGQVVFDAIESIPPGGEVVMKITARADKAGNMRFRAELNCAAPETKLIAEESTRFYGTAAVSSKPRTADQSSSQPTPARR